MGERNKNMKKKGKYGEREEKWGETEKWGKGGKMGEKEEKQSKKGENTGKK